MNPEHHAERLLRWAKQTGKPVISFDYGKVSSNIHLIRFASLDSEISADEVWGAVRRLRNIRSLSQSTKCTMHTRYFTAQRGNVSE